MGRFTLTVYQRDEASEIPHRILEPKGLRFGTRRNAGYSALSLQWPADLLDAFDAYEDWHGRKVRVHDRYGEVCWEGLAYTPSIALGMGPQHLALVAVGYGATLGWHLYTPSASLGETGYDRANQDGSVSLDATYSRLAQGFQLPRLFAEAGVWLWLKRTGFPDGQLYVQYESDGAGNPNGIQFSNARTAELSANQLSTQYHWVFFPFGGSVAPSASTQYHCVLYAKETTNYVNGVNTVDWGTDVSSPGYANGQVKRYDGAWQAVAADACFAIIPFILTVDILKNILANAGPELDSSADYIEDQNARTIIDPSGHVYGSDMLNFLVGQSDDQSPARLWYWEVYNKRLLRVRPRATAVNWVAYRRDAAGGSLARSLDRVYNSIIAHYQQAGYPAETAVATNASPYSEFTKERLLDVGESYTTRAVAVRDAALEVERKTSQEGGVTISRRIYDAMGNPWPLWYVKAGDVLRVADLVPAGNDPSGLDSKRTFMVMATEYDAETDKLGVELDFADPTMAAMVARLKAEQLWSVGVR